MSCHFFWTLLFWCTWQMLLPVFLANIVVFGRCYCHVPYCGRCCTTRSDVITHFLLWCRCYYHMVDVVTCCFNMFGRCYYHCFCDRWYCHNLLYMAVPYHQGLSERFKKSCNKFGVQVHFKGGQTIKSLLMAPKDKCHYQQKWSHIQIQMQ